MVLVHRLRRRDALRVAGFGSFLFCAGFAMLPFGSGFAFASLTVLVWTAGEMLSLPILSGWVGNRAEEGTLGATMGLFNLSFSIALVLGPPVGTWIYARYGGDALWAGCGILGLVLWAGFSWLSPAAFRARMEAERV
jgi:predicted MFS family arabinose efflux permease